MFSTGDRVCPVCIDPLDTPDDYCFTCEASRDPANPEDLLVERLGGTGKLIIAIIKRMVAAVNT